MTRCLRSTTVLLFAVLLGACENATLIPPTASAGPMFARYVALGNSITAGFQSGGLSATTQNESYAVLLAGQMGTDFVIPELAAPGCPPLLANIFTLERVATIPNDCAFRAGEVPEHLNLVAIPGAAVIDIYSNLDPASGPNSLTTILGGGRTQIQNAARVQPTFVTVWIGNNDALGAISGANAGDPSLYTTPATFASRYGEMMDSLDAIGSIQGGVLIGAVQVVAAPFLTQGRAWFAFEPSFDALVQSQLDSAFQLLSGGIPLPTTANFLDVALTCVDFVPLGATDTAWAAVPFAVGGPFLAAAGARAADSATVDSLFTFAQQVLIFAGGGPAPDSTLIPAPSVLDCSTAENLTAAEVAGLTAAVAQYNVAIEAEADERGWVFVDPNDLLLPLLADPTAIRPFPAFPGTASPSETATAPFGSALSLDGIHPSAGTHRMVAAALIAAINAEYQTSIPALP